MGAKCLMCGGAVAQGFLLCEKCDRPRKAKTVATAAAGSPTVHAAPAATAVIDDFPKAAIVPFPLEAASTALTSLANVLVAAGAAAIVIGADRSIKFVTDDVRVMFGASNIELSSIADVERLASIKIGELAHGASWVLPVRNLAATLVPLSGGAAGAVLVFRAAAAAAGDITVNARAPKIVEVLRSTVDRFTAFAELKGIRMQVDMPDVDERFRDHDQLADALGILIDNSLHYVPPGGQVVTGCRLMEHKGKPLLLFFVMDNGAVVPEHMRHVIFESGFVWNPALHERTGRSLWKVRDFAMKHAGSVWTEAKSGKACTFFLRVRPDGAS